MSLDALDTAILRELQADARRTNRDIAAAVGVAPTTALIAPAACASAGSSAGRCSMSTSPRSAGPCRR